AADRLARCPAERAWGLCGRGGQRLVGVVLDPGHRRRLAGAVAGPPSDLAAAGPDGGRDDVRGGGAVDFQLKLTIPRLTRHHTARLSPPANRSGTSIPYRCCVVKRQGRCYDPALASQRVQTRRRSWAARDRPCANRKQT